MLVKDRMTRSPQTVGPDASVPEALGLMREKKVRRLPVVDAKGKLAGIVSDKDLLYASPSPTTSLSVFEINYLLGRLTVEKVMTRKVLTVAGDTPLEEAARVMADNKIGGLPVLEDGALVGIITETDVFRSFIELFGGRRKGLRVTAAMSGAKGTMARITGAVSAAGGDIVGLGIAEKGGGGWELTIKVRDLAREKLLDILKPVVDGILDVREV